MSSRRSGVLQGTLRVAFVVFGLGLTVLLVGAPAALATHHEKAEMSEAQKVEIFQAALDAERRADADTARKFPNDPETEAAMDFAMKQLTKYRQELLAKYGISSKQLTLITAEGYDKSWPTSPVKPRTSFP